MSITIKDISQKLGISVSTISKALNGYPDVSTDTLDRMLEMARELDYHPKLVAQSLQRCRTSKIDLLINIRLHFISEYISEIISGAALTVKSFRLAPISVSGRRNAISLG